MISICGESEVGVSESHLPLVNFISDPMALEKDLTVHKTIQLALIAH
jgi:hypothetical protein